MKTVSIIGFGRFGKTLYRLLCGDFNITLYSIKRKDFREFHVEKHTKITNSLDQVYKSEVIFYCVPISRFESVIKKHHKYFNSKHVLIDVLSVKEWPKKIFSRYLKGLKTEAILTHPMFGPDSSKDGFNGLRLVIDRFRASKNNYQFWKKYFLSKRLEIVEINAKKHDELAARSQGVTHFLGRVLFDYGFAKTKIDTRGAEVLQKVVEQTCNDTWELFSNLQNYNYYTKKMRIKLGKSFDSLYNRLLPQRVSSEHIVFGIQGGIGSFNEQAILKYISDKKIKNYKILYLYTSENVLRNVYGGNVDYGLFATTNSIGGIVTESVKAMSRYKFNIVADLDIPIQHFLMKRKDVDKNKLLKIMAHPQILKQCKTTLSKKFPNFQLESGKGIRIDTAKAAEALAKNKIAKTIAILGPKGLAELYDFDIIAENLQDDKINITSFLLIKR